MCLIWYTLYKLFLTVFTLQRKLIKKLLLRGKAKELLRDDRLLKRNPIALKIHIKDTKARITFLSSPFLACFFQKITHLLFNCKTIKIYKEDCLRIPFWFPPSTFYPILIFINLSRIPNPSLFMHHKLNWFCSSNVNSISRKYYGLKAKILR